MNNANTNSHEPGAKKPWDPFTSVSLSESVAKKIGPSLALALLGTSDGERISALNAINRILQGGGLDAHALVDTIGKIPTDDFKHAMQRQAEKIRAEEEARAKRVAQQQVQVQALQAAKTSWLKIAEECLKRRQLRKFVGHSGDEVDEREFVEKMHRKAEVGDEPTPKEGAWLKKIYARSPT
jgi:hypothetical protein